jgi:hypothetical protein
MAVAWWREVPVKIAHPLSKKLVRFDVGQASGLA